LIETITTPIGGVSKMVTAAALLVLQYSRKLVTARYAQGDEWVNAAAPSLERWVKMPVQSIMQNFRPE
jgi:hypothetical protein